MPRDPARHHFRYVDAGTGDGGGIPEAKEQRSARDSVRHPERPVDQLRDEARNYEPQKIHSGL
ncbi:hypothetical protein D3C83_202060 [compost metagenome]